MNKKAFTAAVLWAVAVEVVGFALKFGLDWNFSMLGIQIGVIITAVAEYFIVKRRDIAEQKKMEASNKRLKTVQRRKEDKTGLSGEPDCPVFCCELGNKIYHLK